MSSVKVNNYECFEGYEEEFYRFITIKSLDLWNIGFLYAEIRPFVKIKGNYVHNGFKVKFYFFSFNEENNLYDGEQISECNNFEELITVVSVIENIFRSIEKLDTLEKIKTEFSAQCVKLNINCVW